PTSVGKDTQHELDQPLKKSAYVSNHRGPLLYFILKQLFVRAITTIQTYLIKDTFIFNFVNLCKFKVVVAIYLRIRGWKSNVKFLLSKELL
ncbi:hypothetical protein, partial [Vibrio cincinnatiensis]